MADYITGVEKEGEGVEEKEQRIRREKEIAEKKRGKMVSSNWETIMIPRLHLTLCSLTVHSLTHTLTTADGNVVHNLHGFFHETK